MDSDLGISVQHLSETTKLTDNWEDSLDGRSAQRKAVTYTRQHKQKHKAYIHASSSESRTHDPSVRMGEDISFLRARGHCDRRLVY
jgi:hypothetical protein